MALGFDHIERSTPDSASVLRRQRILAVHAPAIAKSGSIVETPARSIALHERLFYRQVGRCPCTP